jgi:hypothetical protein
MGPGDRDPPMNREASPLMKRENPTPGSRFRGLSTHEARMTFPDFRGVAKMSDKSRLSDILFQRQARRFTA